MPIYPFICCHSPAMAFHCSAIDTWTTGNALLTHDAWNTPVTFLMLQEVLCMVCHAVAAYLMFRIPERAVMRKTTIDLYGCTNKKKNPLSLR
ncbi:hypothetical protein KTG07_12755 [[Clostridium] innocuum]|nr:hypothetical protein [[Clostridium] innocuum]